MELDYRFTAEFTDGSSLTQSEDDAPRIASRGSSFTDVLELEAQGKKVASFHLANVNDGRRCSVDLIDGHFEVDGKHVWLGEELPPIGSDLKLIFFRRVRRDFNPQREQTGIAVRYCLGWESHVDGQKFKQIMGVY